MIHIKGLNEDIYRGMNNKQEMLKHEGLNKPGNCYWEEEIYLLEPSESWNLGGEASHWSWKWRGIQLLSENWSQKARSGEEVRWPFLFLLSYLLQVPPTVHRPVHLRRESRWWLPGNRKKQRKAEKKLGNFRKITRIHESSELSILFHQSFCMFVCQYYSVTSVLFPNDLRGHCCTKL